MKGLGGYHLVCDAGTSRRSRNCGAKKHREEKPFAVMVPDVAGGAKILRHCGSGAGAVDSAAGPIVLAGKREGDCGRSRKEWRRGIRLGRDASVHAAASFADA